MSNISERVDEFLENTSLAGKPYSIPEMVTALRNTYRLICEGIHPTDNLRAAVIQVGQQYVVFYPEFHSFYVTLQGLSHEVVRISDQIVHLFRRKSSTQSGGNRPPISEQIVQ